MHPLQPDGTERRREALVDRANVVSDVAWQLLRFLKSQHQLVAFTTSAFDCELPFRADDGGTAVASGDRVLAKDGRQNSIAWVLDLQQREWVSPPFDGGVETGMRLNGARARPDLGGPRLAAEGEGGDPPRDHQCAGHRHAHSVRHEQAESFVSY